MQQESEDSSDSQESLNIGFSFLKDNQIAEFAAAEESSQERSFDWDHFQENPSFLDPKTDSSHPEENLELNSQVGAHSTPRRQSSTDNHFLEQEEVRTVGHFVFCEDHSQPLSTWPPRNPSSEPDIFLESNFLPAGLLDTVEETSLEDEVFDVQDLTDTVENIHVEANMPPKTPPTTAQLYAKFIEITDEFDQEKDAAEELGGKIPERILEGLSDRYKEVLKLARDIKKTDSNYAEEYPDFDEIRKRVQLSWMGLLQADEKLIPPAKPARATDAPDVDTNIDKAVHGLQAEVQFWSHDVAEIEGKMLQNFTDNPTPGVGHADYITAFVESLNKAEDSAKAVYIKLAKEVSGYQDEDTKTRRNAEFTKAWQGLQNKIRLLILKGKEYVSKLPPAVATPRLSGGTRSIPLERLPLPTFKGNKIDYLRFKQEFVKHVKYETDEEKMLALKTKCLVKAADKQRTG